MENFNYEWQGDPVEVKFGFCKVLEVPEKPLWWYNYECSINRVRNASERRFALIPAIQVTQYGRTFVLANHFGIGHNKLIKGGWPNHAHFSMSGCKFTEDNSPEWKRTSFYYDGYAKHEAEREKWQRENYPEEYKQIEALKAGFYKSKNLFNS